MIVDQSGENPEQTATFTIRDRYIKKPEVARLLGVTTRTVDSLMKRGHLVYYKIGRTVRFRLDDIERHLNENSRICRRGVS